MSTDEPNSRHQMTSWEKVFVALPFLPIPPLFWLVWLGISRSPCIEQGLCNLRTYFWILAFLSGTGLTMVGTLAFLIARTGRFSEQIRALMIPLGLAVLIAPFVYLAYVS